MELRPPRLSLSLREAFTENLGLKVASFVIARLLGAPFVRRRLIFPTEVRDDVEALLATQRGAR